MENFKLVFVLRLMIRVLGKTQELSQCLQRKNQNIVHSIGMIGAALKTAMGENGWDELFNEERAFCVKRNIVVPDMKIQ
jgi:hypothetical protein